ncbi:hypothetical protein SELR_19580 [Selenomonas ruminantium subsp. lactilytica TAM6421]|uniref:Uncharacterized protein n=1 Tax=Selenomonas ruminantium subsp. lactilytica (strain NBRC 103574 / TAM6421) TaxID=927704 RepID=I0GSC9_SELRL|nr:hypothetical protein SELR_19580 [Selenomonas ruminantium subsp. lactilytica TAM6421]
MAKIDVCHFTFNLFRKKDTFRSLRSFSHLTSRHAYYISLFFHKCQLFSAQITKMTFIQII